MNIYALHVVADESIVALQSMMRQLDPAEVAGTVVAVTITSLDAYYDNSRVSADDGKNLARCWPGASVSRDAQCWASAVCSFGATATAADDAVRLLLC